jgi:hypothetical protein
MSPEEIVEKSKETYGKAMCMDCVFEASEQSDAEEIDSNSADVNSAEAETAEDENLSLPFDEEETE